MKTILFFLLFTPLVSGQCEMKTTQRPDGNTIKYFNPKPVIHNPDYDVAVGVYKNINTGKLMFNVSVLFNKLQQMDIHGNLTIQTDSKKGLVLKFISSNRVQMNGRELTTALYEIDQDSRKVLEGSILKSLFFTMQNKLRGSTVTENKTLIKQELLCFRNK